MTQLYLFNSDDMLHIEEEKQDVKTQFHVKQEARALRDDGIERATDHAERANPLWNEQAYGWLRLYAKRFETLTAEQVRKYAEAAGFVEPPDKRSWAGCIKRATHEGWLTKDGIGTATDPRVHCNRVTIWRSKLYQA